MYIYTIFLDNIHLHNLDIYIYILEHEKMHIYIYIYLHIAVCKQYILGIIHNVIEIIILYTI